MKGDLVAQHIGSVGLLVRHYDEAIAFYCGKLGFALVEDTDLGSGKRWVRVAPPGLNETTLLLARASSPAQIEQIGRQGGGRVWLFLKTDSFAADYTRMAEAGVHFTEQPRQELYGWVVVFEDLYGNKWDLLEVQKERGGMPFLPSTGTTGPVTLELGNQLRDEVK